MDDNRRKIAVVGAGAVGGLIGGLLAKAGEDVTLIGRPDNVEAIRQNGLKIEGILGSMTIPVKAAEELDFHPDIVLLGVKTQDVEAACREIKPFVEGVPVVTLQNGVRADDLAAGVLSQEQIVSGVAVLNAQYLQPGKINYVWGGALTIGEPFGPNGARVREIQALLAQAIPTEVSDEIRDAHWTKLLINNLANGLEAMAGIPIRECLSHQSLRKLGVLELREGQRVIRKAGYHMAALRGVPLPALRLILRAPMPIAARVLGRRMGRLPTLNSTLQSLKRGKPTEIEYLNGEIVRLAQATGQAAPYNAKIVEVVKEVEKSGRFFSVEEIEKDFNL